MAFKMKASPAKRGAIEGAGPNSPMKMGAIKTLVKGAVNYSYKYGTKIKNAIVGTSNTTKAVKSTVTGPNKIKNYMRQTTPRYHPQTGKLVNPPPITPTNLNQAAEKLNKSAKYYGN